METFESTRGLAVRQINYSIQEMPASLYRIPLYVWVVLLMVVVFALTVLGMKGNANALFLTDLFAEFSDLFPGQPKSVVEARGFFCHPANGYNYSTHATCKLHLENSIFSSIDVLIFKERIKHISFHVRSRALHLGDIVAHLESATMERNGSFIYFPGEGLLVTLRKNPMARRPPYFAPVLSITFVDADFLVLHEKCASYG